jgi:anaerobic selenocysteine-containing dehydrogenase
MGAVHASRGRLTPPSKDLLSEVAILARLCAALFDTDGARSDATPRADWGAMESDYALIRAHIAKVVPGFERYEERIQKGRTLFLPNGPRDARRFATVDGRARFTANPLEYPHIPPGRLLLQTLRSHDQYNTTIYGKDDRYRGVYGGRRVVLIHAEDVAELGFTDGDIVDLVSEWTAPDGSVRERRAEAFRIVPYPTPRRNAAAYYPETNVLVPLESVADVSNTPTSKSVIVRLEARDRASSPTPSS